MKKLILFIFPMLCSLFASSNAALIDNGNGTITQVRTDGSRFMWVKDANYASSELSDARVNEIISAVGSVYGHTLVTSDFHKDTYGNYTGLMTWWGAMAWADQLVLGGYDDWRLPDTLPVDGLAYDYNFSYDGSTDRGFNISAPGSAYPNSTGSEMSYMYHVELGNKSYCDTSGSCPQPGWGLINTAPFTNIQEDIYWSSTVYSGPSENDVWTFEFADGYQEQYWNIYYRFAWAVRSVPDVSGCIDLDGSPLIGMKVKLKQTGVVIQTTIIDNDGCYEFSDVVSGKAFTVQINGPKLSAPVPVIHGCAYLQGLPMPNRNVILKQKNETNKITTTGADGCYSFTDALLPVPDKKFKLFIKGPVMP